MRTLLLVVNDTNILYLLGRYAEESQFKTVNLGPEDDVLAVAQNLKPAAIIVESKWVGESGLLGQLKGSAATRGIPVLAYIPADEETTKPMAGVAGFLHDPVSYGDFVAALRDAGVLSGGFS